MCGAENRTTAKVVRFVFPANKRTKKEVSAIIIEERNLKSAPDVASRTTEIHAYALNAQGNQGMFMLKNHRWVSALNVASRMIVLLTVT